MNGYTKLFGSIVASTIWREDNTTRIVWITMLALKDQNGVVEASIPGLADLARVKMDELLAALRKLQEADPYSRTKEFEGRRIEEVEGGWRVLNHRKYRDKLNQDERREYLRIKQQEHRDKLKLSTSVPEASGKSVDGNGTAPVNPPAVPEKPPKPEKTPPVDCVIIFTELNDLTGSKFRPEGASLAMLVQRLAQPDVTTEGVLQMVRRQVKRWKDDPKMCEYLTPLTLFNATKFNNYYAAREQPVSYAGNSGASHAKPPIVPVKGSQPVGGF